MLQQFSTGGYSKLKGLTLKVRGTKRHPQSSSPDVLTTTITTTTTTTTATTTDAVQSDASSMHEDDSSWVANNAFCKQLEMKYSNMTNAELSNMLTSRINNNNNRQPTFSLNQLRQLLRHFSICQSNMRKEVRIVRKMTKALTLKLRRSSIAEQRQNQVIEKFGMIQEEQTRVLGYLLNVHQVQ